MSADGPDPASGESRSAAGRHNPWLIAIILSIATFMQVLDTSIVNVALRYMAGSLAAGIDESTWVVTSYLVANAIILPASGWLSNVIGRKRYYMICVALFTISSLLCGLAPSLTLLIFFRVLQGLGGGGMAPAEQAILNDTFPGRRRAQAFALYGIAVIVAPTVGPTLGGWITDNFSWHWIFFINIPIGFVSLALVQWLVSEPAILERERRERLAHGFRIDWFGFLLVALCLGCLEVVLDRGQQDDWFHSGFIALFAVVSALSLVLLVPWELAHKNPVVDLRLLFTRQFGIACLVMTAVGAILFGSTQLLPQLVQTTFGYTATLSGLSLMPGGLAMLVLMPLAGSLSNLVSPKYLIAFGMALVALSMGYLAISLSPDSSFGFFAWARVYQTIGLPFLFVPITAAAFAGLPPDKTNDASALINVVRNLGGSIGVSVANAMLVRGVQFHQNQLVGHLVPSSPQYQRALQEMAGQFVAHGASPPVARQEAFGWLGDLVSTQSTLLSYVDIFFGFMLVAAVTIPLAFLLRGAPAEASHPQSS